MTSHGALSSPLEKRHEGECGGRGLCRPRDSGLPGRDGHGTLIFIAVGTPAAEDGSADLAHVLAAAATIGRHMSDYKVIVDKSTVPVGTAEQVQATVALELKRRAAVLPYAVVSNPEFLKEGAAIEDFMRPDRVVLGVDDEQAMLLETATSFCRDQSPPSAVCARFGSETGFDPAH